MGVAWAVLQFPMLFGGGAAVLLITRILLGGAEGPATAVSLSSAHSWFKPAERVLPSNLIAIGSTLGPVLAAPFLAFIISSFGWRWAFGALGILGLAWILLWWKLGADGPFAGKDGKAAAEALRRPEEERRGQAEARRKPPIRPLRRPTSGPGAMSCSSVFPGAPSCSAPPSSSRSSPASRTSGPRAS